MMISSMLITSFIFEFLNEFKKTKSDDKNVVDFDNERNDAQLDLKKIVKNRV